MHSIIIPDDGKTPVWYDANRLVEHGYVSSRGKIPKEIENGNLPPPVKEKPGVMQSASKYHGATVRHLHGERIKKLMEAEARPSK
jgi:hypothetical protein